MRSAPLHLAAVSHPGRRRRQEDAWLATRLGDGALLAVADGMGGHAAGDVASRLAVDALRAAFRRRGARSSPREVFAEAAGAANRAILERAAADPASEGLGTTLVAAVVTASGVVLGHAGDSRAYLVTADGVTQLTRDHSVVQDALDRGGAEAEAATHSPFRHAVLRCLGDRDFPGLELTPEDGAVPLGEGSILLLSSDGAHGWLTPADLLEHLVGTPDLRRGLDHLLRLAVQRGSDDNLTLVACEVGRLARSRTRAQAPSALPRLPSAASPHRALTLALALLLAALVAALGLMLGHSMRQRAVDAGGPAAAVGRSPTAVAGARPDSTPWAVATPLPTATPTPAPTVAPTWTPEPGEGWDGVPTPPPPEPTPTLGAPPEEPTPEGSPGGQETPALEGSPTGGETAALGGAPVAQGHQPPPPAEPDAGPADGAAADTAPPSPASPTPTPAPDGDEP